MSEHAPERDLVSLFAKALRRLGDAGQPQEASRLAAQAWSALKDTDPRAAEHVNGVMHYLARLEADQSSAVQVVSGQVVSGQAASEQAAFRHPQETPAADTPHPAAH